MRRNEVLVTQDVFVKHTDKDGRSHVQHHRAWDVPRFLKALAHAAAETGGDAAAEAITEEQYQRARRKERTR